MSRCFPFPPPGYEARPRSEQHHKDLLKKEKHKEKKHRKEMDKEKGETKEKDRDNRKDKHNKKHKREKRRDRRKNEDRDKDKNQSLGQDTQKNYKHGNRKPEEREQNEPVKDIKPTDELITRSFVQEGSKEKERISLGRMVKKSVEATQDNHGMVQKSDSIVWPNKKGMGRTVDSKSKIRNGKNLQVGSAEMHFRTKHSCNGVDIWQDNCNAQRSSKDIHTGNPASRREANGRMTPNPNTVLKAEEMEPDPEISVHSAKGENGRISTKGGMMAKENQSANNFHGKMNQQVVRNKDGEVERDTNYRKAVKGKDRDKVVKKRKTEYKNNEKEMEKNSTINEHKHEDFGARKDQVDKLQRLGFLNEQKFTSDNIKKRKDFDANSSPHEHSMRMTKLPRVSPTKDEEIYRHSQQITPYSSTELFDTNTRETGWCNPQDGYNNVITGTNYSEEDVASVSSSGYKRNKGHLKQTHPDTEYLSQLYTIPPEQDFSYYIDQDWLFSQDREGWKTAAFEAAESDQSPSDTRGEAVRWLLQLEL
ncbi:unnamed protein product [Urochloa humidicola]